MALQGTAGTVPAVFAVEDATADDHEGILALTAEAFGPADELMVRARLDGPQGDEARWTVVRDGGRVVSTCTLLPFPLRLDGVDVPAGQIELVATDPAYRRRGLVRRQIDRHHERSAAAGHVVQLILGIPYVYRRFGYGYGIDHPALYTVRGADLRPDPAVTIRPAGPADLDRLDDATLARGRPRTGSGVKATQAGLTTDHRAALGRRLWAVGLVDPPGRGPERVFVAERDGAVVGLLTMSLYADEQRAYVTPSLAPDRPVSDALVAHAEANADGLELVVIDTPGSDWTRHLDATCTRLPLDMGVYARIADPVAALDVLRPVLSARLRTSPRAGDTGAVTISTFVDAARLHYAAGEITAVERVTAAEDPFVEQECGVAPDWFPALVLGRWGARGLEQRVDDVSLGRHGDLLEILFPRRPADIVDGF
jgi:predicted N-acetyltransferase YhbS